MTPVTVPVRPPGPVPAPLAIPLGAMAWVTVPVTVVSGPAVTPVRPAASPGSAAGWLVTGDPGPGRKAPGAPWTIRWTVPLTPDAAAVAAGAGVAGADGVLLAVPATVLATVRATVPVTVLVTAGTALADVAVAEVDVADAGAGWVRGCDPAGWPEAARPWPWPWVTPWTVWLTLASAPPAGDWPGLPPGAPDGACPGSVLAAAGPVLEPPDPPGKMSWVTPLTADTAALVAEHWRRGRWRPGRWRPGRWWLGRGPGSRRRWFRAAGQERWLRERPERRQRWQRVPGWPDPAGRQNWAGLQKAGWPAEAGWAGCWVLGAGPRRTGPGCHCPVRGCCRCGRAARCGEEALGRASHRTGRGCSAARQARREPADARSCSGAGGLRGAWILRGDRVLVGGRPPGQEHSKNKRCGQTTARVQANPHDQQ